MAMEDEVDPIQYFRILWKGKWIIAAFALVALVVAGVLTWNRPEHYVGIVSYSFYDRLAQYTGGTPSDSLTTSGSGRIARALLNMDTSSIGSSTQLAIDSRLNVLTVTVRTDGGRKTLDDALAGADTLLREEAARAQSREQQRNIEQIELEISLLARERDLVMQEASSAQVLPDARLALFKSAADVESRLASKQAALDALRLASVDQLMVLERVGSPVVTVTTDGRIRPLVIAGILGCCAGALASFLLRRISHQRGAKHEA